MTELRKGLPPLPARIRLLPLDPRGYPIPWFVAEVNGKRDFRIADTEKRARAVNKHLCWICGQPMGRLSAFVIGPMCAVNRNTSEPPSHRDCAEFAVQACPFLILPDAQYRDTKLPEGITKPPGFIDGNPGACCIWITQKYEPYWVTPKEWLIRLGEASTVSWWMSGRPATRDEILESIDRRIPTLQALAQKEGPKGVQLLARMVKEVIKLLPPERAPCKCNCGYTCGGPGTCKLGVVECLDTPGHWVKDCGHEFAGWVELENGGSTVCEHCGMTSMHHDSMVGP